MHRVLVLGGSGLVGKAIISEMNKCDEFQIYGTYYKTPISLSQNRSFKLDIEDLDNINSILANSKPQSVVSCLRGDYDKQLVLHIKIAEYLKKNNGILYFCSTANVFDNNLSKAYYEDDLVSSRTEYGQYKIKCEKRVIEILNDNACILRLPQVWGKDSPRMKDLLKSLNNKEKIVVYPNLLFNTITDIVLAKSVLYIIKNRLKGIFHLATQDVINHKDFYNELLMGLGFSSADIEENLETEGVFALLSKRDNELPEELGLTNRSVINHLVSTLNME
ncbi:sugar nucleotide-binding protein [Wukongibacter baidiensis]|uniref:sugar nucleotide-binding protein n=1 Tax=Wukongibacter baidiensis TaxID=1723361 RepID=UPI003D7F93AD